MINTIEFEVKGQILSRIDSQEIVSKNQNIYKCQFNFEENSEWLNVNKFAIFKDGWGNTYTQHLGNKDNTLSCFVPDKVLKGSYFKISVYGGNLSTTNIISIALIQSGFTRRHEPSNSQNNPPTKDIWVEVFDSMDALIDSIIYDNKTLYFYHKDKLIETLYLPFIEEDELKGLVDDIVEEYIINIPPASEEQAGLLSAEDKIKLDNIENGANRTIIDDNLDILSDNPVSNKTLTKALKGKEDTYNIVERIDNIIVELINNGEN